MLENAKYMEPIQLDYHSRTGTAALREKHKLKENQLVHITLHSILEEASSPNSSLLRTLREK